MTESPNFPNREDKVRELLPDEREALIRALETGRVRSMTRLIELGLIYIGPHPTIEGESKLQLTPAGHILAVELRKSDRLERARGKLAEWAGVPVTASHQQVSAHIELPASGGFVAVLTYQKYGADYRDCYTCAHDDPLTAVIEASKQTPWELEE